MAETKTEVKTLGYMVDGEWRESQTDTWVDITDSNTGEVIARTPMCTEAEVTEAIESAHRAFGPWASMPVQKRTEVLFTWRPMLLAKMDEIATLVSTELGKNLDEARGEVVKIIEAIDIAVGAPMLMKGESLMNVSTGHDTVSYREPLGVFAGIAPFNFPAMIPFGWMLPICIACGNTFVLKAANPVPLTSHMLLDMLYEAGLPKGVVNMVTAREGAGRSPAQAPRRPRRQLRRHHAGGQARLRHRRLARQARAGADPGQEPRPRARRRLARARRPRHHQLDLRLRRHALHGAPGLRGRERGRRRVRRLHEAVRDGAHASAPPTTPSTELGPVVSEAHKTFVTGWIDKGVEEGAELLLDGRDVVVPGYEGGHFIGATIFDHVTEDMVCGREESFGPVLYVKRVDDFEEGLTLMNNNPYANGSCVFTESGYYSREFARRTHAGMVGINVGIPVPVSFFPFSGHKDSFFGDNHVFGKDGFQFFTETKCVTTRWFTEADKKQKQVSTWEGTVNR